MTTHSSSNGDILASDLLKLEIISSSFQKVEAPVEPIRLSPNAKFKLMMKRAGMSFGAAVLSILIPVFHFVLVPLFLILTVYFFFKSRKLNYYVPAFQSTCPHCKGILEMKALYLEDEYRTFCELCRDQLKFEVEGSAI